MKLLFQFAMMSMILLTSNSYSMTRVHADAATSSSMQDQKIVQAANAEVAVKNKIECKLHKVLVSYHEPYFGFGPQWFKANGRYVAMCILGPETNFLGISLCKTVQVWDVQTGKSLAILKHEVPVRSVAFSVDGAKVLSINHEGRIIQAWDMPIDKSVPIVRPSSNIDYELLIQANIIHVADYRLEHAGDVRLAALSPDKKRIISADDQDIIHIWDTQTGLKLATIKHAGINSIAFSQDGKQAIVACMDKQVYIWNLLPVSSPVRMQENKSKQDAQTKIFTIADLKKEAEKVDQLDSWNQVDPSCFREQHSKVKVAFRDLCVALSNIAPEQEQAINAFHKAITENVVSQEEMWQLKRDIELLVRDEDQRAVILDNLRLLQKYNTIQRKTITQVQRVADPVSIIYLK